jgi:hypothetical protein
VATGRERWRIPGWYRLLFVSNDGAKLVTVYDGLNLLPLDHTPELVLLTFWREGREIAKVTVKDIAPSRSSLRRTISHYHWGDILGLDDSGELRIRTAGGSEVRYDLEGGRTK